MFYIVDKPIGPSCNQVLAHLKRFFGIKKAGHSGTLDPLASGMLIVGTEGSTKLLSLLSDTKTYEFTFDITNTSPSLDTGEPLEAWKGDISDLQKHIDSWLSQSGIPIETILNSFRGTIEQIPPRYSAVWVEGQRAYSKARKGWEFELPSRKVEIHSLSLHTIAFPFITCSATVSAGTYIRSLARDIGTALGWTAVITQLRRTGIGKLMLNVSNLEYKELHPGEQIGIREISYASLFPDFETVNLTKEEEKDIWNGTAISCKTEAGEWALGIGYIDASPLCLLQREGEFWKPIRVGI
jgi:tRNA pseudouridine55 synthase